MAVINIRMKRLEDLTMYENNPRKNDLAVDKVAKSIQEFGFKVPLVIDRNNVIVCGHTRYKALQSLGWTEAVPCVIADDLTDEQVKAFRIVDNKSSEESTWDFDLLEQELNEIDLSDFDFDFDFPEIDDTPLAEEDEFDFDGKVEQISNVGDIWKLGNHVLMCGDSTNPDDVKKLMGGVLADMVITDPPYNVGYVGKTSNKLTIKNDNQSDANFRKFLDSSFLNLSNSLKAGGSFYIWFSQSESENFYGALNGIDNLHISEQLIWNKNRLILGRFDYHMKHEGCIYGWKSGETHKWYSDRKQSTILEYASPEHNDLHPTMKPIALFDYLIRNSTKKGDVVLDLFGGSGTTIIACEQNGRIAYSMEYDPKYVDVIISRWEQFTNQKAEKIGGIENV